MAALVADQFDAGQHLGVQVAAIHEGEQVVDLAEGWLDARRTRPVTPDSLFCCFSTTKALGAFEVWRLVADGRFEIDSPVGELWPGFAAPVSVAQALSHQGGLHRVPVPLTTDLLVDDRAGLGWVASLTPAWPPGTASGYHTLTYGWLVRGIVEAVTGAPFPRTLAPGVFVGLPVEPATIARSAQIVETEGARGLSWVVGAQHPAAEAMPPTYVPDWNDARLRHACQPAFSGWASARALAELAAAIPPAQVELGCTVLFDGVDRCLELPVRRGLGVELGGRFEGGAVGALGPRATAFGHGGHGGQVLVRDPEHDLTIAVLVNLLPAAEAAAERTTTICELIRALCDAY